MDDTSGARYRDRHPLRSRNALEFRVSFGVSSSTIEGPSSSSPPGRGGETIQGTPSRFSSLLLGDETRWAIVNGYSARGVVSRVVKNPLGVVEGDTTSCHLIWHDPASADRAALPALGLVAIVAELASIGPDRGGERGRIDCTGEFLRHSGPIEWWFLNGAARVEGLI